MQVVGTSDLFHFRVRARPSSASDKGRYVNSDAAPTGCARGWAANNWNSRIRLKAENDRLRQEIGLLEEELRIKDARMLRVPAHHRPHYAPTERLAILELRAARAWSLAQTARRLLVTTATVASWMRRLNEDGPNAIIQMRVPVNKFPELVHGLVRRLKQLCPSLGQIRIAQMFCRAGLHLSSGTVRRSLKGPRPKGPLPIPEAKGKPVVRADRPNHVWSCDLTTVPTSLGFWASWLPGALPQCWPFCWWVAVVVDHFSRRIMGSALFPQQPTSLAVRTLLARIMREANTVPRYLVTDQGGQFTDKAFRRWSRRRGIHQRFGAVRQYGSIAVIERLIRTIKQECTRRLLVPYTNRSLSRELSLFAAWYNTERPHQGLSAATPDETYRDISPACMQPRFEPRPTWPRGSPCAAPLAPIRGRCGAQHELRVGYLEGRKHQPIVTLERAA